LSGRAGNVVKTWTALLFAGLLAGAPHALAQEPATTLAHLASPSIDQRRGAAATLASLGSTSSDATGAIAQQLAWLRRNDDGRVSNVMRELRFGSGTQDDLVELLVQLNPDPAVARALATACLVRALTHIGTTPAVRQLVMVAADAGGVFRPALFKELKTLDERATAALIEARGDASPDIRAWAKDVLEALGKRTPGDSVQTTDDRVLVDVLRAYAAIRDIDATPVVLSFVNSDRSQVRAAAREATLSYGQDALGKVRATYAALTGERLPDNVDAGAAAHELFDAYDHYRLRDVYARLDEGLAKQQSGDIDAAIADFENVLARQPVLDRRAEIVPGYVAYAELLEQTDRAGALQYLRGALRLDDADSRSNRVRSEIRYLEGEELISRGVGDTEPFEQALALDPQNAHARAKLDDLRAGVEFRRARERRFAAAVIVAGLALLTIGVIVLRAKARPIDHDAV
jgi:tetratricopeptide (TPR) repeat protein